MSSSGPFIRYPDPRFGAVATTQTVDPALRAVGSQLVAAAESVQAYGLAAVHVGVVAPIVVVSVSEPDRRDYRVFYNPRVISAGSETALGREGSVSMPGVEVDIARATGVVVGFDDENGQGREVALTGFVARVAQHEIDQVNGIFFLDRLSRLKREAALRRFAKLERRSG
ncbi:hypothetical protein VW35_14840 [Devosia soli]|uniref:Peptide deformylase-like n=2 Tax=Devosia soli TaxID=361041 RepID=A0A0F5L5D6_9HYPH|nr:hypothetical protein VW35_14840 [Devosia soli]